MANEETGQTGTVLLSESILAILPGADLVPENRVSRSDLFERVRAALIEFRELGGATIVDMGGLTTGRDTELLEMLSRESGVEIVASTGFGAPFTIGSHFTNNVGVMTDDRIADIFRRELQEGLLVETRGRSSQLAGIVSVTQSASADPALPFTRGQATIEADTVRASARAALAAGASVAVRVGDEPRAVLAILAEEGVPASRTIVLGLDRVDHVAEGLPSALAAEGFVVGFDHVGWPEAGHIGSDARVELVRALIAQGYGDRIVVSGSAVGASIGWPAPVIGDFTAVLRDFAPAFRAAGGTQEQLTEILRTTPRRLLARDGAATHENQEA